MPEIIDQAKVLELCLLEKECPCDGRQLHPDENLTSGTWCEPGRHSKRCPCKGTGCVPLLDPKNEIPLRLDCPGPVILKETRLHPIGCQCKGTTLIPSTDPWAYVNAAWDRLITVDKCYRVIGAIEQELDNYNNPGLAAFNVVYAALVEEKL